MTYQDSVNSLAEANSMAAIQIENAANAISE
jgi:hypothetical protein